MTTAYKVTHNEQSGSFEVFVEGHRAHLDYRRVDDSTWIFVIPLYPASCVARVWRL